MGGQALTEQGYTLICLGEPTYLLGGAIEEMVEDAKSAAPSAV